MSNRKDDHIHFALAQSVIDNDFDRLRFAPVTFPEVGFDDLDLSVNVFGTTFPYPFYINAMTGGSDKALAINQRLAQLAKAFSLPMATGSLSTILKDPSTLPSFQVIKEVYPEVFLISNLGGGHGLESMQKVNALIGAKACQLHVNAVQEITMPEGDRDFKGWLKKLKAINDGVQLPFIVKEVGFGMSRQTILALKDLGVRYIDVAGRGGTNFSKIENNRNPNPLHVFDQWGFSTVESLLSAQGIEGVSILSSGGIRYPLDVIKSLALGASAVGMSGYFLRLVTDDTHEEAVKKLTRFIDELKSLMVALGAKTILDLKKNKMIYDSYLMEFKNQL
jgi:isopentenyl-diphosphate delta-isomerase